MTATKNAVFIGLWLENCCLVEGEIDFWWEGEYKFDRGKGGGCENFWLVWVVPPVGKTV